VIGAVLIPQLGLLCASLKSSLELGSDGTGAWPLVQQSAMQLAAPLKRFIAVMCAAAARRSWHRRWSVAYVDVAHAVSQVAAILRSASGPPVLRHLVEWIDSGLLTLGAPADAQAAGATNDVRFLEDLLAARADTDGGALATVMAELYTERQPLGKRGGAAVARAERAVAAALLHHTGRINTGRSFATIALHRALKSSGGRAPSDSKTKLPPTLRSLWERAYQVRSWLINKLHALETDDNKDGAELLAQQEAVCDAVVERMRFLFGTVPLTSPAASDVAVADSAQTLFSSVAVRGSGGAAGAAAAASAGASPQSLFAGRKGLSLERVERSRGSGDGRALLRGSFGVQNAVLEGDARVRALLETYSVWRTWRQRGGARPGMALSGSGSGASDAFAVAAATVASEAGGTSEAAEAQKAEPLVLRFAMAENVAVKELATLVLAQNGVADARSTSLALALSTLPTGGSAVSLGSKLLPDILAAVMNSLLDVRKPHALMAHYAQQLQVCGAAQRALLRDSFMALYGALVDVARQLRGVDSDSALPDVIAFKRTCFALLNMFLFRCTRDDHDALQRSRVFALLRLLAQGSGSRLLKSTDDALGGAVEETDAEFGEVQVELCRSGHELERGVRGGGWYCDVCRESHGHNVSRLMCGTCAYDMCDNCAARSQKKKKDSLARNAPQPAIEQMLRDTRRGVADAAWSAFATMSMHVMRAGAPSDLLTELQKQVLELALADVERVVGSLHKEVSAINVAALSDGGAWRARMTALAAEGERNALFLVHAVGASVAAQQHMASRFVLTRLLALRDAATPTVCSILTTLLRKVLAFVDPNAQSPTAKTKQSLLVSLLSEIGAAMCPIPDLAPATTRARVAAGRTEAAALQSDFDEKERADDEAWLAAKAAAAASTGAPAADATGATPASSASSFKFAFSKSSSKTSGSTTRTSFAAATRHRVAATSSAAADAPSGTEVPAAMSPSSSTAQPSFSFGATSTPQAAAPFPFGATSTPQAAAAAGVSSPSFSSPPSFSFGSAQPAAATATPSFGSATVPPTSFSFGSPAPQPTGFSFGSSTPPQPVTTSGGPFSSPAPQPTGFSFVASASASVQPALAPAPQPTSFSFGSPAPQSTGFSFGSPTPAQPTTSAATSSGFSFGSSGASGFSFASPTSSSSSTPAPAFLFPVSSLPSSASSTGAATATTAPSFGGADGGAASASAASAIPVGSFSWGSGARASGISGKTGHDKVEAEQALWFPRREFARARDSGEARLDRAHDLVMLLRYLQRSSTAWSDAFVAEFRGSLVELVPMVRDCNRRCETDALEFDDELKRRVQLLRAELAVCGASAAQLKVGAVALVHELNSTPMLCAVETMHAQVCGIVERATGRHRSVLQSALTAVDEIEFDAHRVALDGAMLDALLAYACDDSSLHLAKPKAAAPSSGVRLLWPAVVAQLRSAALTSFALLLQRPGVAASVVAHQGSATMRRILRAVTATPSCNAVERAQMLATAAASMALRNDVDTAARVVPYAVSADMPLVNLPLQLSRLSREPGDGARVVLSPSLCLRSDRRTVTANLAHTRQLFVSEALPVAARTVDFLYVEARLPLTHGDGADFGVCIGVVLLDSTQPHAVRAALLVGADGAHPRQTVGVGFDVAREAVFVTLNGKRAAVDDAAAARLSELLREAAANPMSHALHFAFASQKSWVLRVNFGQMPFAFPVSALARDAVDAGALPPPPDGAVRLALVDDALVEPMLVPDAKSPDVPAAVVGEPAAPASAAEASAHAPPPPPPSLSMSTVWRHSTAAAVERI
jgi:hypothetical protein